jgi:DNA-binding beta-propeller fold protein YncE
MLQPGGFANPATNAVLTLITAETLRFVRGRCFFAMATLLSTLTLVFAPAALASRTPLDIRVFARVPTPGQPEPVAVGPDRRIYVGTNQQDDGDSSAPSEVFVYSRQGHLRRAIELRRQRLDQSHGIQGLAFDGEGRLYALDRSAAPRVVRINLKTGHQRDYARFRDVPSCSASGQSRDCSATTGDLPPAPDYAAFAPDGHLYATDIDQALIWRVPPGGGRPRVWFTDPLLESIFGPNGIQVMGDGRTLVFADTVGSQSSGHFPAGALYTLRIRSDGRPGPLTELWLSRPADGPDGFAIAQSGRIYVALAGANQIAVISPEGEELARAPATSEENSSLDVPLDGPASVAFLGRRLLVTNQSLSGNPSSWAVLDVFAGERGLPLFYP